MFTETSKKDLIKENSGGPASKKWENKKEESRIS